MRVQVCVCMCALVCGGRGMKPGSSQKGRTCFLGLVPVHFSPIGTGTLTHRVIADGIGARLL